MLFSDLTFSDLTLSQRQAEMAKYPLCGFLPDGTHSPCRCGNPEASKENIRSRIKVLIGYTSTPAKKVWLEFEKDDIITLEVQSRDLQIIVEE
jgi:hypothetical protein